MSIYAMRVFTDRGVTVLGVQDEGERSTVGLHWNAIKSFLRGGEVELLEPFEGQRVAGRRLQTDPDEIETWAYQGDIDWEDIYAA
jgi:hypothetical protein